MVHPQLHHNSQKHTARLYGSPELREASVDQPFIQYSSGSPVNTLGSFYWRLRRHWRKKRTKNYTILIFKFNYGHVRLRCWQYNDAHSCVRERTIYILKISLISYYKMFENIFIGRFSYCSRMYLCDVFLNSAYDGIVSCFSLSIARQIILRHL